MSSPSDREEYAVPVAVVGMVPALAKVGISHPLTSTSHLSHLTSVSGPLITDAVRLPAAGCRSADYHQVLPGEDGGPRGLLLPPDPPGKVVADQAGPDESLPGHTKQGRPGSGPQ